MCELILGLCLLGNWLGWCDVSSGWLLFWFVMACCE